MRTYNKTLWIKSATKKVEELQERINFLEKVIICLRNSPSNSKSINISHEIFGKNTKELNTNEKKLLVWILGLTRDYEKKNIKKEEK